MHNTLNILLKHFDKPFIKSSNVIQWGSPVPAFGNLSESKVATLGLNPSNREFVDTSGNELEGSARRFHTLKSLGLKTWAHAQDHHLDLITESCNEYFNKNPYNLWFKKLDQLIAGTNYSYYGNKSACHLDLIPFATACKWTELNLQEQNNLLDIGGDILGHLLRDSPIEFLILNGRSVVSNFERLAGARLDKQPIAAWNLNRSSGNPVLGNSYYGLINEVAGVKLKKEILVLGFNHNLQSSFGVTTAVKNEIKNWIQINIRGFQL